MTGPTTDRGQEFIEDLARRVGAEYHEMPGLQLTSAQARCLFGLETTVCAEVLETLCERGILRCRSDGQFVRD